MIKDIYIIFVGFWILVGRKIQQANFSLYSLEYPYLFSKSAVPHYNRWNGDTGLYWPG